MLLLMTIMGFFKLISSIHKRVVEKQFFYSYFFKIPSYTIIGFSIFENSTKTYVHFACCNIFQWEQMLFCPN